MQGLGCVCFLQDFFSPLAADVGPQGRDSKATLIPRASHRVRGVQSKAYGMGVGFWGFRVSGV